MAEKKATKKGETSLSKKAKLTSLERYLCSLDATDRVVTVQNGDTNYEITIRSTLDFETRNGIMENVKDMYFPAGSYDKNYGDTILEFILFQLYTGMTFNNDVIKFDRFMRSDYFRYDAEFEKAYRSADYYAIKEAVEDTVKAMLHAKERSVDQENFYHSFNALFEAIRTFIDNADGSLTKIEESLRSDDGVNIKSMLDALQQMNAKDEKKIVSAVLDYQESKAKKQAASSKPLRI